MLTLYQSIFLSKKNYMLLQKLHNSKTVRTSLFYNNIYPILKGYEFVFQLIEKKSLAQSDNEILPCYVKWHLKQN